MQSRYLKLTEIVQTTVTDISLSSSELTMRFFFEEEEIGEIGTFESRTQGGLPVEQSDGKGNDTGYVTAQQWGDRRWKNEDERRSRCCRFDWLN